MKSVIYLSEKVENKDRRFGSALEYLPVTVVLTNGTELKGLFTVNMIREAIERGKTNPEDFPIKTTLWQRIWKWFSKD